MKEYTSERLQGLNAEQVKASRAEHGSNTFGAAKKKSFIGCFVANLCDPVIKILLIALGVNLILVFRGGDIIETLGIGISVFLATFISTMSERGSEEAFRRLEAECSHALVRTRRDGKLCELSAEELVVGDIILLSAGEQVPADAFVLSGKFKVDQAMITGESREVEKLCSNDKTKTPASRAALFKGSSITHGEGEAEIFAVGEGSFLGQISDEVKIDTRESPLKIRLSKLARQISRLGYLAAFFIALTYIFNTFVVGSGFSMPIIIGKFKDFHYLFEHLLHAFMLGLTVIVMAVPEGLPMMIAVVLSANIRRMVKDNVLVRKPVGIEAAGSMNILFTDKTGTLTEGKMSVSRVLTADGGEYTDIDRFRSACPALFKLYSLNARFNTSCSTEGGEIFGGNATERAILASIDIKQSAPSNARIDKRLPFDSNIKFSAAALRTEDQKPIYLIKGAPERLFPLCRYALDAGGKTVSFSSVSYKLLQKTRELSAEGHRLLCVALSDKMPTARDAGSLTFVCTLLLADKIRPEARQATAELAGAGVGVVMITGDNKDTAEHIARECGIITRERHLVLGSDEIARLDDEALKRLIPSLAVLSRALPSDKSRLVRLSQEMGLVVGMTGDGINDAPALKRADIGFSMGSGTGVAKESGDIIILDNNLSSIAKAVLYGRTIFKSIRKFITLQLTMNLCAVGISMIGPFIGYEAPVTVVQMLWINIIMDTLGGLAFAGEAPRRAYMKEAPKKRDEPILNRYMIGQIAFSALFTVGLYVAFLLLPSITSLFRSDSEHIYLLTAFFALFIFTSVLHCFNARTDRLLLFSGLSKNKAFIAIITAVSAIQIAFIYLGGPVLRTLPLTRRELLTTLLLSLAVIPADLARKAFLKAINKKSGF